MPTLITYIKTFLSGELVGTDSFGNHYYQDKKIPKQGKRRKRWVVYADSDAEIAGDDASRVPASHFGWLHHTQDDFPSGDGIRYDWQQPHAPNKTGTPHAYRPEGHVYQGGERPKATGDYQAWSPE